MKKDIMKHILLVLTVLTYSCWLNAQTDMTNKITNPSFESGSLTGWTWTGTTGYAWLGPNTDGDATKNGSFICGIWNGGIGDAECSQTITGLSAGYYQITALATVSQNRLTNQRLFANNSSQLYGELTNTNYSASNLAILANDFGENSVSFAGYATSSVENGPFRKLKVVTQITDGTLKIGFRVSGRNTTKGFVFTSVSSKSDEGFFKFDHFTLTDVSNVTTLDGITLSLGSLDTIFDPAKTNYTATLPAGVSSVKPSPILSVEGQKVTGDEAVDVSSGTGVSTIVVTSPDGNSSKTYTITYTLLNQAYKIVSDGVELPVPNGSMKIKVCTDKIIQVLYANTTILPQNDTIIVNKVWDSSPDFSVSDAGDTITIVTESLKIQVSKSSYLVRYYDLAGNLILAEASKTVVPVTLYSVNTNTCTGTFYSPASEGLYGLGQHQQRVMNYKGNSVALDQQNKEIALPFLLSTSGYGLLWDNYSYTDFKGNVAGNTQYQFSSESGKMVDYYFMYGPEPDGIINQYRIASGKAPMFPKWAYGLFQSKDKYTSATELLTMANKYREAGFPLDCIVQDWDYWTPDFWGSHTVNTDRYPDPKALVDSLHALSLHTMISIWPVFHKSTANYQEFNAINAIYPSAGNHHFYDPHNDAAKKIYWNQVNSQLFAKHGWDAWWADNNEPQGYPDSFDRKNFVTAKGPGVTYYNTYPIQHTAAYYFGWRTDHPDRRVFTLSRSAFPGQQRYATAAWSGDIYSTWNDFQNQLSAGLNFSMSGMPYWTTDIGGYFYVDWSTVNNNELMSRWFQYGAFCPIFRIHGQGDKALVSSTLTANTVENLAKYNKLRYRLMPYIYSQAWKVTNENYTIMRHLVMDYRADLNVRNIDNQFMFGPSLMINPVTSAGINKRTVYLPAGKWFDFWTGKEYAGSQTITADAPLDIMPIFVKAGSIIPMGPDISYATQSVDPTDIRVYKGANGSFVLYEDEGDSYNYEIGEYTEIPFTYDDATNELTIGARKGSFMNMMADRTFRVVLVDEFYGTGLNSPVSFDSIVSYNGTETKVSFRANRELPQTHYEAEEATLSGEIQIDAAQAGYSGSGYVSGFSLSKANSVVFNVTAPKKGLYNVTLRYAAGSGSVRRNLTLTVNNSQTYTLKTVNTKDWSTWGNITNHVALESGLNTLSYTGDSVFVALDCIDLSAPTSIPYQTQSRICRIRQLNGTGYIGVNENGVSLMERDTISQEQLWKIEKISEGLYKLTSSATGKTLSTVGSAQESAIHTSVYSDYLSQQWDISDFGNNIFALTSFANGLNLSSKDNNAVVQKTNSDLLSQRWVFEDTTVIQYNSLYESFDYEVGSGLDGTGSRGQGWGGPWVVYEGVASDMTINDGEAFAGLATQGNKLKSTLSTSSGLRAYREIYPKWSDDGQDVWVSFLMDINNPGSLATSWQGLSLFNGSAERILFGKDWGQSVLGINEFIIAGGLSTVSAFSLPQTWIVVLIKMSGNSNAEQAYMWINPDPKTVPSISAASAQTTVQLNNGFDRIVCHLGNTAGISVGYDEIRLGRTYSMVSNPVTGLTTTNQSDNIVVSVDANNKLLRISAFSEKQDVMDISVFDINGRQVLNSSRLVSGGHNSFGLSYSHLAMIKGVYLVSIKTSNRIYRTKVVM